MVTLAALIARGQFVELPLYINLALDHGVKPREISEVITHLAFYAGWGNAMSAIVGARSLCRAQHRRRSAAAHFSKAAAAGRSGRGAARHPRR